MNWIILAVLSPAVYSLVSFVDKYILSKHIKDYRGMSMFAAIMAGIFGTTFWLFSGRMALTAHDTFFILTSGMLTFFAQVVYFKALCLEDASKILIIFSITPVYTLILSFLFLGEQISWRQLIGFMIILISVIGVSLEGKKLELKLSPAFYLMLLNSLLWSVGSVLFKYVIDQNSFVKVVSYESWGIALGGLIVFVLFKDVRKPFFDTLKTVKKTAIFYIFVNEGVFVFSRLLAFLAMSIGPLMLVSIIGNINVFFGIIYGIILTLAFPKLFNEDISRNNLVKKTGYAVLAFLGIVLIN